MMSRFAIILALTLGLTVAGVLAQDAPVKGKPGKQGDKQLEKKADDAKAPAEETKEDPKKIMERIARNMVAVEANLKKSDVSDATRKLQRDIVSDLDKLLEQEQNKNKNCEGGQNQGQKSQDQKNQDQKNQDQKNQDQNTKCESKSGQGQPQGEAKAGSQQPQPGQAKAEGAKKDPDKGQPQEAQLQEGADKKPGPKGKAEQLGKAKSDKEGSVSDQLRDPEDMKLVKEPKTMKDVSFNPWGHLPEKERPQMNIYAQDRFIPQYEDQLQQYFRALAAKNRQGKN